MYVRNDPRSARNALFPKRREGGGSRALEGTLLKDLFFTYPSPSQEEIQNHSADLRALACITSQ